MNFKKRMLALSVLVASFFTLTGCFLVEINEAPNGKTGEPFAVKISEGGFGWFIGLNNVKSTITNGSLPAGLEMADNGYIEGIITDPEGEYTFTVSAVDQNMPLNRAKKDVTIKVDNSPYEWTILIHMAVDNNISETPMVMTYLMDLMQVKALDLENKIRILIMNDTVEDDYYNYLTGFYFNTEYNMFPHSVPEINSGDVEYTKDFIDWAFDFPNSSEHYMYIIFNHGSGFADFKNLYANPHGTPDGLPLEEAASVKGIGFDDNHEEDSLSHYELSLITQYLEDKIGHNLDIFYPFACLMGGVELADEIKENVDYLLSSEELVLGMTSFPNLFQNEAGAYFGALTEIIDNPDITPSELGIAFCDSIVNYIKKMNSITLNPIPNLSVIYSLIDLSFVDALYDTIDAYATAAISAINDNDTSEYYNQAADDSLTMAVAAEWENYIYMDLGNYLNNVKETPEISETVKGEADNVLSAIDSCIIYNKMVNPTAVDGQYYTGFSIFHNIWGSDYQYPVQAYIDYLAFGDNTWADYVDLMDGLAPTPTP